MKIGIFGGCFNPPHKMHKEITLKLIDNGYLDKVIFLPTGDEYTKEDLACFNDRINMIKLMIKDKSNIIVSEIAKTHSYTYLALDYFKNMYKVDDIYFICGTDNLDEFDTWKKYEYILENYMLLVIKRNNDNIDELLARYNKYISHIIVANIDEQTISSTNIRKLIKNGRINEIYDIIDKEVLDYIIDNKLYIE